MLILIGDKNFRGKQFEADLAMLDAKIMRPRRKDEPGHGPHLAPIRQRVESVLGLQTAHAVRAGRHPTRARADLPQDRRARSFPAPICSSSSARRGRCTTPSGVVTGWQVKRRLGPAWIERGDAAKAERRRTRHDGWIKRRGRVEEGYLTEDDAVALIHGAIADHEAEQTRAQDERAKEAEREITFDEIAKAWLGHRIAVVGIKRTTRSAGRVNIDRCESRASARAGAIGRARG
jgi:hypothetical protein